ncbi:MAG: nuclear transport factor 2 family protein [Solirubrobacterales bacterium]
MSSNASAVRAFVASFNSQDLDAFVAVLHPEVEIVSGRGSRRGREQARTWATFKAGGVRQRQVIDELVESGDRVLALNRRQWYWDGTDELAAEDEMAYVFTLRDGLILRWEPFEDRPAARAAAGADA